MNLAFYVSGSASRFRKILGQQRFDLLRDTKLVMSDDAQNEDLRPQLESLGIRFICVEYRELASGGSSASKKLSEILLSEFTRESIDYCFCFGVHVLKGKLIQQYSSRIINFHPSVLPLFPGLKAIDQAIESKVFLLGNTAHFISDQVDQGPIIMQSVVLAKSFDSIGYETVLCLQLPMLYQIYEWLVAGRIAIREGKVEIADVDQAFAAFFPPLETGGGYR